MKEFFDTNVLLYQYDGSAQSKRGVARARVIEALRANNFVISTQVMMEFYFNVTRKFATQIAAADAQALLHQWATDNLVVTLTPQMIVDAASVRERFQLSWWDANIVVAAQRAGAQILVTEDLQHGFLFDKLRVENPFVAAVNEPPSPYPARKTK